ATERGNGAHPDGIARIMRYVSTDRARVDIAVRDPLSLRTLIQLRQCVDVILSRIDIGSASMNRSP
ncbi:hypothetical protein, partial [Nocardia seriolae]|uniref:hypothetical protein n=1 Tax=Nocardia seriolae TaxID=37332 RepID=UPI001EE76182